MLLWMIIYNDDDDETRRQFRLISGTDSDRSGRARAPHGEL